MKMIAKIILPVLVLVMAGCAKEPDKVSRSKEDELLLKFNTARPDAGSEKAAKK